MQQEISSESAWIEVIHKMDAVYADLVHYQVELEQKNAELEQAQQFIHGVLSSMTDVLIVCDHESTILEVNKAFESVTGFKAEALTGCPLGDLFGEDANLMQKVYVEHLNSDSLMDCEINIHCADGSSTPLAMNCSRRFDAKGKVAGAVIVGRPVGELRRAYQSLRQAHQHLQKTQQQLLQSEKMASLGRLVAGVAHELNNPISVIFGNMHVLKGYGKGLTAYIEQVNEDDTSVALSEARKTLKIDHILEDMQPLIEGSLEGAERVSNIVQDLRRYSGNQREMPLQFDLVVTIRKAVQWGLKAVSVEPDTVFHMPAEYSIVGCKGQVHQILVNLVQNAVDAMSNSPVRRLEIRLEAGEGTARIFVRDHGPGIKKGDLMKIFDPFYTSKPVGEGTGLGLYISYGLAQELGGSLQVQNASDGGAIFILELPTQPVPERGGAGD